MIPEYIRFYGGTPQSVLNTCAVTFFAMLSAMYQLKAQESLNDILSTATAQSGNQSSSVISALTTQSKGKSGVLDEVRNIKK